MLTLSMCLLESKMDAETTRISRLCMQRIIEFIKNPPQDYEPDTRISARFDIKSKINADFFLSFGFFSEQNPNRWHTTSGEYSKAWDGTHLVEVSCSLPAKWLGTDLWKPTIKFVHAKLKGTIQHELEHLAQAEQQRVVYHKHEPTFESWVNYLLNPSEIEAHVVELLRKARMMGKVDLSVAIQKAVDNRLREFAGKIDENELAQARKKVIDSWKNYAVKRFPKAR